MRRGALGEIVTVTADHGQWFAEDAGFRLFAPELGGGALLDLGVYPVSFASMVLGTPNRIAAIIDPAFTGVDAQTSMVFGYESGAQAVLTCTLRAKSPTRASIVGTDARIEIEGDFYAPATVDAPPKGRRADPRRVDPRGPGPAPPGRRGGPPAGRGGPGEPADAAGRDDLDHGDDGRGAGAGSAERMNDDLTPTSVGRGGDDGAFSRRTSVSLEVVTSRRSGRAAGSGSGGGGD